MVARDSFCHLEVNASAAVCFLLYSRSKSSSDGAVRHITRPLPVWFFLLPFSESWDEPAQSGRAGAREQGCGVEEQPAEGSLGRSHGCR